jgi:hypothetical protein
MRVYVGDESFFKELYLVKDKWQDWEWPEIDFWRPIIRGVNVYDGPIRSGKSTAIVVSSFKGKKYFDQGAVFDSPGLVKKPFGDWQFLDWRQLLENLARMAKEKKIAKYQVIALYLLDLYRSVGVDPRGKTINIDEAFKVANKRRGMADTIQIVSQTARQIAHLGSCLQISSQDAFRGLDQNEVVAWTTTKIVCNYDEATRISYYAMQSKFLPKKSDGGMRTYSFTINPDNWKDIYDSFSPIQKTSTRELVTAGG